MYIAELGGHRIRKIDPAGIIWTLAGQSDETGAGIAGYDGDGGPSQLATLNAPTDILVKDDGTVIVSDLGNHVVREISQDGRITTIAGTGERGYTGSGFTATESSLAYPGGLALNSSGELLIADGAWTPFLEGTPERGNECIRKINEDGNLEDLVGRCAALTTCFLNSNCGDGGPGGNATLGFVNGLAVDSEDRILIADYTNGRLRRVRPVHESNNADYSYILGPSQKEVFVFDLSGRHLETRDANTNALQLTFHYVGGESGRVPCRRRQRWASLPDYRQLWERPHHLLQRGRGDVDHRDRCRYASHLWLFWLYGEHRDLPWRGLCLQLCFCPGRNIHGADDSVRISKWRNQGLLLQRPRSHRFNHLRNRP